MRLRTRLALAFLLLSVVPLTAITLYSYSSSIAAFRRAVEAEEAAVAADMGKRMELATTALSDRFDRISAAAEAHNWSTRDPATAERFRAQVASTLGDAGPFVSKLQFIPSVPPSPPPPPSPRARRLPSVSGGMRRSGSGTHAGPGVPGRPADLAQPAPPAPPPGQADAAKLAADASRLIVELVPTGTLPPEAEAALAELKNLTVTIPKTSAGTAAWSAAMEAAAKTAEERTRAMERRFEAERGAALNRRPDMQRWFRD